MGLTIRMLFNLLLKPAIVLNFIYIDDNNADDSNVPRTHFRSIEQLLIREEKNALDIRMNKYYFVVCHSLYPRYAMLKQKNQFVHIYAFPNREREHRKKKKTSPNIK